MIPMVMTSQIPPEAGSKTSGRAENRTLIAAAVWQTPVTVPKQKQIKMQMQVGALAAIPQLESRTDEQLQSESKHRVAAKAILGARASERYDVKSARKYFNEALAGCIRRNARRCGR